MYNRLLIIAFIRNIYMAINSFVGQRIRSTRKNAELTLRELAEKTGLGKSRISNYEQGIREPHIDQVVLIAKALCIDPCHLMGLQPTHASTQDRASGLLADEIAELVPYLPQEKQEEVYHYAYGLFLAEKGNENLESECLQEQWVIDHWTRFVTTVGDSAHH